MSPLKQQGLMSSIFSKPLDIYQYLPKKREETRFWQKTEIAGTFMLITFFLVFAVRPAILTITKLYGEIKQKEELSKKMKRKLQDIISAQVIFSDVQEKYFLVYSGLPETPRYVYTAVQLKGSMNSSNSDWDEFEFNTKSETKVQDENAKNDSNLRRKTISIQKKIDFTSLSALLNELDNNRRLFTIDSISVSKPSKEKNNIQAITNPNDVRTTLNISYYYWPTEKEVINKARDVEE